MEQIIKDLLDIKKNGLGEWSLEKIGDIVNYNAAIKEFLKYVTNREVQEQMDCLLEKIKSKLKEDINSNNICVLQELDEYLDDEMRKVEVPEEQQQVLKSNLMAFLLTYIHNKDTYFFNILISRIITKKELDEINERINRIEHEDRNLLDANLKIRRVLISLNLNNAERLIGREEEKQEIQNRFDSGSNVVFLSGRPGIGKTTLARMYANICEDSEIYFEEYEQSMEYTIAKIMQNSENSDENKEHMAEKVLAYWESLDAKKRKSVLLVIDNFNRDILQNGSEKHYIEEVKGSFFGRLKEIGIHILITTRINIFSESSIEVGPVRKTMELFEKYYGSRLREEQKELVKELIEIVQGNTMLIAQSAIVWKKSDTDRKQKLIEQLKNCQLKENDILLEEKTLYGQVKAMLNFSGIRINNEINKTFASAALMPLKGEHRDKFLEMSGCDINKLNELIEGNWVLIDSDENISLHPVVKEIAIQEGFVDYKSCEKICNYINNALKLDLSLTDRYPYAACAWEIYKIFSPRDDLNDVLIRIFYRLSDICDNIGEHKCSMEIIETITNNLYKIDLDILEKAQMLSGIAYSINNYFKNMNELDRARDLLETAQKELRNISEDKMDELDVIQTRMKILNNIGSNNLAKRNCMRADAEKYLRDALKWHQKTLDSRLRYLDEFESDDDTKVLKRGVAISYTAVATDQFYLKEYEKAISNHLKACKIREGMKDENAICVNQERIIGCFLGLYKEKLSIDKDCLEMVLSYYPELLKTNYKYHNMTGLKTNVNYFKEIVKIIQYDRRAEGYVSEALDKQKQIMKWMEGKEELMRDFGDLMRT